MRKMGKLSFVRIRDLEGSIQLEIKIDEVGEEKYAFFRALRPFLAPEGAILVGDVSFPTRQGLEQCQEAYGAEWDAEEFYFVREELEQALPEYHLDAIPISFCADILILTPEEG